MAKKRKKSNKRRNLQQRPTRQRDVFRYHRDEDLLPVAKKIKKHIDKNRANDYIRDTHQQKEIRHDLRKLTRNRYLRKNPLRFGSQDKIVRLYLHNRTLEGKPYKTTPRQGFRNAKRVEVCQRRRARRETLFRLGKAGKGKRIRTKKHRNEHSNIKC